MFTLNGRTVMVSGRAPSVCSSTWTSGFLSDRKVHLYPLFETRLLDRVGINVHAKRAHGNGVWQSAKRLFLHLDFRFLVHLHRCIDRIGSHAPQLARIAELRSVDPYFDALFGVGWIEHGERQRLAIFA